MRAPFGEVQLLVYCECPCGRWVGNPEGGQFPVCDGCGGFFVPGGGAREGEPMFGTDHSEARRLRCLGFVSFLTTERAAVRLVGRLGRWLGLGDELGDWRQGPPLEAGRLYLEREVRARSDEVVDGKRKAAQAEAAGEGEASS